MATAQEERRCHFLGCPVDLVTLNVVIEEVKQRIAKRAATGIIQFINANKVVKSRQDPALLEALEDSDFMLADGKPLLPLGRCIGIHIPERIDGIGLMMRLLAVAEEEDFSVYLLGAKQEVLDQCLGEIRKRHPGIRIAGSRNGYFGKDDTASVIDAINAAQPDLLFLGMGSPMKERFAYENRSSLSVPIVQGVGGSFDVIAGVVNRAPLWMQKWGVEWFYRVIQEPKRMFWRYLSTNTAFLWLVAKRSVAMRLRRNTVDSQPHRPREP